MKHVEIVIVSELHNCPASEFMFDNISKCLSIHIHEFYVFLNKSETNRADQASKGDLTFMVSESTKYDTQLTKFNILSKLPKDQLTS